MDEGFFELFGNIILHIIFNVPGAFIRWLIYGRRNRFNYYLEKSPYNINALLGVCTTVVVIVAVSLI
jgi:glycopeptide antibiotics resistance protein